ncbi:GNAT family N-acetyltransferase [Sediminitomix flava]|uniref:RimJ/RimL family protein N-acetyltransferase n=1 Tax=Sediminitomix flava TaxID=379075 RepID=A0A315ZAJ0_SEDFL|nr:GNAT family N-acetyltransferase [Sediminitomix flava]PWJ42606.1 RimJ/RimL family protein N-acetyltransferase [Sediminitomix flava]
MQVQTIFETERLFLRPANEEDATFYLELMNSPKYIEFIGDRNVRSVSDAIDYIREKIYPQYERLGYSAYTVIRKSDGKKIGTCGLYDRIGIEGIDIGFGFLPQFEKQGYAFEAASKLKEVAFEAFGITTISGITTKENFASQKLLERLGLKQIGTQILPTETEELLLYSLKRELRSN